MIANALTDEGRAFRPDFRKVRLSESSLSTRRVFLVVGWGFGGGEEGFGAEDVDAVVGVDELGDVDVAGGGDEGVGVVAGEVGVVGVLLGEEGDHVADGHLGGGL